MVLRNAEATRAQFAQLLLNHLQPFLGGKSKVHKRFSGILLQFSCTQMIQTAGRVLAVLAAGSGALARKLQPSHLNCPSSKIETRTNVHSLQCNHTLQLAYCISVSPGCKEHHLLINQRRSIGVVLVRELRQDSKVEEQHA